MLMSMFSSLDALCAESFGHKVCLSWAPGKQQQASPLLVSDRKSSADGTNNCKDGTSPPLPPSSHAKKKPQNLQRPRKPRFAVELDGVHCFETIIPY